MLAVGVVAAFAGYWLFDYGYCQAKGYADVGLLDLILPSRAAATKKKIAFDKNVVNPGNAVASGSNLLPQPLTWTNVPPGTPPVTGGVPVQNNNPGAPGTPFRYPGA